MFWLAAVDPQLLFNPMANKPSTLVTRLHRIVNNILNVWDSQSLQHLIRISQAALVQGSQRISVLSFLPLNAQQSPMLWAASFAPNWHKQ
jgi:hypothetical protein